MSIIVLNKKSLRGVLIVMKWSDVFCIWYLLHLISFAPNSVNMESDHLRSGCYISFCDNVLMIRIQLSWKRCPWWAFGLYLINTKAKKLFNVALLKIVWNCFLHLSCLCLSTSNLLQSCVKFSCSVFYRGFLSC